MVAEVRTRTLGLDRMRSKATRMNRFLRGEVAKGVRNNGRKFVRAIKLDIPVDSGALIASIRSEPVKGTFGTAWRVSVGDDTAYYARFVEFGTSGGVLGAQPAQAFYYPNYRSLRRSFRNTMTRAYRRAAIKSLS